MDEWLDTTLGDGAQRPCNWPGNLGGGVRTSKGVEALASSRRAAIDLDQDWYMRRCTEILYCWKT